MIAQHAYILKVGYYGENSLTEINKASFWKIFKKNLGDFCEQLLYQNEISTAAN